VKPNPCPNALENGGDGFHSAWDCPAECTYQSIGKPKPSPSAACPVPGCVDGWLISDGLGGAEAQQYRCTWPGHGKDAK